MKATRARFVRAEPPSGPTEFQYEFVIRRRVLEHDVRAHVFGMTQEISVGNELESRALDLLS